MEPCCSRFTPTDGGARLAVTTSTKNILAVEYEQFISTRLLHEEAYLIRGLLSAGCQRSIYVCRASRVPSTAFDLRTLTDLTVAEGVGDDGVDWSEELEASEVLVCTSKVLKEILEKDVLTMSQINILIVDSAHLIFTDENLKFIMTVYKQCEIDKRPRILALTYPPFAQIGKECDDATEDVAADNTEEINESEMENNEDLAKETDIPNNDTQTKLSDPENDVAKKSSNPENDLETKLSHPKNKVATKLSDLENYVATKLSDPENYVATKSSHPENDEATKLNDPEINVATKLSDLEKDVATKSSDPENDVETKLSDPENDVAKKLSDSKNDVATKLSDSKNDVATKLSDPENDVETKLSDLENDVAKKLSDPEDDDVAKKLNDPEDDDVATKLSDPENDNVATKVDDDEIEMGAYENLDDFKMYEMLEWKLGEFEKELCCEFDLAEDIDGGKRLASTIIKPKELIIEYNDKSNFNLTEDYLDLDRFMRDTVQDAMDFLTEHRYDPTEIYGEDMFEELKGQPDPTLEPKSLFKQFLYILDQLGPYGADKAAFTLLSKLEKLKIRIPYERHFLLLCLCTTALIKIRSYADIIFSKHESDWEKIKLYSTPKVLRLAEILEKFQPEKPKPTPMSANSMLKAIEKCDFLSLSNKIEDRVNTFEANLKEIDEYKTSEDNDTVENDKLDPTVEENSIDDTNEQTNAKIAIDENYLDSTTKQSNAKNGEENSEVSANSANIDDGGQNRDGNDSKNSPEDGKSQGGEKGSVHVGLPRRSGRMRGRTRAPRQSTTRILQLQQNPDALCGIVFMKEALMAKILFNVIIDMSRSHPGLSHLCAQYCAENPEPETEIQESQRQRKKQEEVLKKFRMHECNLLLATSALEEGIDLPRCNLVLRWDLPPSYRSHGLCRSRARAVRSSCALMSSAQPHTETLLHNLAVYRELDRLITQKCGCGIQNEPPQSEEDHADKYTALIKAYKPRDKKSKDSDQRVINSDKQNGVNSEVGENSVKKVDTTSEKDKNKVKSAKDKNFGVKRIGKIDFRTNMSDSDKIFNSLTSNVVCDKCNRERDGVNVGECQCANVKVDIDIDINSDDAKRRGDGKVEETASVDLNTAIALINRYCAKLPSDTFTRLAPQWWMEEVKLPVRGTGVNRTAYICTLKLPLNCPVKYNIVGHPMPTRVLARRMVALQASRILHKSGELDDHLMPIGKENFKAIEVVTNGEENSQDRDEGDARPGTTKRRQYYYKRTAWTFTDCQPIIDTYNSEIDPPTAGEDESKDVHSNEEDNIETEREEIERNRSGKKRNMLYAIVSELWCALPERYNTRGRRLHAPQHASQAIGVLMARELHSDSCDSLRLPAFPVYTRSGEVRVRVARAERADVRVSRSRAHRIRTFMRFLFADVLRVRRRGMTLQADKINNYYVVPTVQKLNADGTTMIDIDWSFLELIYRHTKSQKDCDVEKPIIWQDGDSGTAAVAEQKDADQKRDGDEKKMENPLLKPGAVFLFDPEKYKEAVVTPWYRNQDQPQFFLVAEICWNLTPDSAFPSATHTSFRSYYQNKYGVTLTQSDQPLLDVDHTSARLNLLTPRYVNRKGVALPVSSERTRRAKRDRLDQKQILVPELCTVHPFAAPLWFATVALPCVLYRINALLIADEIRRAVAIDVGLGVPKLGENHQWPPLDFGWSLSEVLNSDAEKSDKKKQADPEETKSEQEISEVEQETKVEDDEKLIVECEEKTLNDILQEKEDAEAGFEIGTWSNDMASSIPQTTDYDEFMEPLPSNLTFCTSASGGKNWCDPVDRPKSQFNPTRSYYKTDSDGSYSSDFSDTDDSDLNSIGSDEETDTSGFGTMSTFRGGTGYMGVRIEYKTAHEAEAVDMEARPKVKPAPPRHAADDRNDRLHYAARLRDGVAPDQYIDKFHTSVGNFKRDIVENGLLVRKDDAITEVLPAKNKTDAEIENFIELSKIDLRKRKMFEEIFPYGDTDLMVNGKVSLETIEKNKRALLKKLKSELSDEEVKKLTCFSMVDVDIDSANYVNEKVAHVGFDSIDNYARRANVWCSDKEKDDFKPYHQDTRSASKEFDFDYQPVLEGHPGPSPSVILQALTMSNANDGINLERLETIGDSFLKFAITAYLYCAHPTVHEGKLSHMRSKQVSNLNLYRLGRDKRLGARMIASKFEPHDNWLPPCHRPPPTVHARSVETRESLQQESESQTTSSGCFIPYNLITQHSIPDKSIADCVEALIGAYLLECGPRGALLFMSWLGIRVLPAHRVPLEPDHPYVKRHKTGQTAEGSTTATRERETEEGWSDADEWWTQADDSPPSKDWSWQGRPVGSLRPYMDANGRWMQTIFGELKAPPSPLLRYISDPEGELERMLSGYESLESTLQYRFRDRSLLLQALTHASHHTNRLTDCYQRLEFLGDAILDYLITRHLYEDGRRHSPGALTDLRSALVNNTIFATLAARHGFHKYFRHMSPGLNEVLTRYVKIQEENGHSISEEHYLIQEDEMEQAEDVEVPKALGDLFESVAGAIFIDSGMSLGAVWRSYVNLMGAELEAFSAAAPKSPVRELLEAEPDTAKFGKPERLADGRRVRVCVEVFGRGTFKGVGRNYRIAKGTAARCALRHLRIHRNR